MEKKTAVIDRIECGIATVIPDNGEPPFSLPVSEEFSEGQTVILTKDGIRPATEDEMPRRCNKDRLNKLFNKNKKD